MTAVSNDNRKTLVRSLSAASNGPCRPVSCAEMEGPVNVEKLLCKTTTPEKVIKCTTSRYQAPVRTSPIFIIVVVRRLARAMQ